MEWPVVVQRQKKSSFERADDSDVRLVLASLPKKLKRVAGMGMLSNGGRFYPDLGYPEYATPEDTSYMGTVANEIAGENIVHGALAKLKEDGVFHDFILNKRVIDDAQNTWGYHISFCGDAERLEISDEALRPLGAHLATISLYAGAGAIVNTHEGAQFVTAQKVLSLNYDSESATGQNKKALINTRREPLADNERFVRVHVTSLDANMSPWASWMKLGTTSLVLRMMEHGYMSETFEFKKDMHQVAKDVARDPDLKRVIELDDGTTVSALAIQTSLLTQAKKMAGAMGDDLPEEDHRVLVEWERALDDLALNPLKLIDRADWVFKRAMLQKYMARHSLSLSNELVIKKERQYSHIGELTMGMKLRNGLWADHTPHERIEEARFSAPTTTRAFARAAFIKKHIKRTKGISVTWQSASVPNVPKETLRMTDPYDVDGVRVAGEVIAKKPATILGPWPRVNLVRQ
jgi:proteasome accessory factor A